MQYFWGNIYAIAFDAKNFTKEDEEKDKIKENPIDKWGKFDDNTFAFTVIREQKLSSTILN